MKKKYLLAVVLSVFFSYVNGQITLNLPTPDSCTSYYDEIIIKRNINADDKIIIELNGTSVLVNGVEMGKPTLFVNHTVIAQKKAIKYTVYGFKNNSTISESLNPFYIDLGEIRFNKPY